MWGENPPKYSQNCDIYKIFKFWGSHIHPFINDSQIRHERESEHMVYYTTPNFTVIGK